MSSWLPSRTELTTFFENYFRAALPQRDIPGAILAVVSNEFVDLSGFGRVDVGTEERPDPESTPHRIASVTKPITALGALMLVDQELLDLDRPVQQYIPFLRLGPVRNEPIRLRHLLTHTAGLDERLLGVSYVKAEHQQSLGEHLAARIPPAIMPPGKTVFYSNYGYTLIGFLIEVVTGVEYSKWITQEIFEPLQLSNTYFETPQEPRSGQTKGFEKSKDKYKRMMSIDFSHILPAGGVVSTASDMSRLLQIFLQPDQQTLIDPVLLKRMLSQQFLQVDKLGGPTFGLFESRYGNARSVSQTGGAPGFGSLLYMLPDDDFGLFLGTNALSEGILTNFPAAILNRFSSVRPGKHKISKANQEHVARIQKKRFRHNRYSHRGLEKLMAVRSQFELMIETDDQILFGKERSARSRYIREAAEGTLFRIHNGYRRLIVPKVNYSTLYLESAGMTHTFERVRWFEVPHLQARIAGIVILMQIILVVLPLPWISQEPTFGWFTLRIAAGANILFAILLAAQAPGLLSNYWRLAYGLPLKLRISLAVPYLSIIALPVSVAYMFFHINALNFSQIGALTYILGILSVMVFHALLRYWNIIRIPPFLWR